MKPRRAHYVTSAAGTSGYPPESGPEIAFAGRSNVGKSSLINTLTGVVGLAKTSRTPGRTRLLNWFEVESQNGKRLNFVDLPGYGYAKVPIPLRDSWRPLIEGYLTARSTLAGVAVLIDARRGAEQEERDLIEWLGELQIPVLGVVTKADKLPKNKRKPVAATVRRDLGLARDPVLFSAQAGEGIDELWRQILNSVDKKR